MLPGMPVADLEGSRFLTCGVSVAIGVTESAYRGLTGGIVMELWIASPDAHRLGVCLYKSFVVISARH